VLQSAATSMVHVPPKTLQQAPNKAGQGLGEQTVPVGTTSPPAVLQLDMVLREQVNVVLLQQGVIQVVGVQVVFEF